VKLTAEFPTVIDNSMRSTFARCPHEFYNRYILNRAATETNVHLIAGAAFAKGVEVTRISYYDKQMSFQDALAEGYRAVILDYGDFEPPADSNKTATRMADALIYYFTQFPIDDDFVKPVKFNERSAVEFNFTIPINIAHPTTGEPILYAGRFDMLGEMNDTIMVVDEKTTSQLGSTWGAKYDLSSQFTGYCWAAKQYGFPVSGVLIRGVSILKEKYGHAQHIMYRPQWQIERWQDQLIRDINRMKVSFESGVWDYDLADACGAFGGCPYKAVCSSPDEDRWLAMMPIVHYTPLNVED
jgi:hypothetical protein